MNNTNHYDRKYGGEEYYWGKEPSVMCDRVLDLIKLETGFQPKMIDLGCGEGRNAVYFARQGFSVTGLDTSEPGLEKTRRYANKAGVTVTTIQADIKDYKLVDTYDIIFSTGTLHFLLPEIREKRFQDYRNHTSPGGLNALNVFVTKPFLPELPDGENRTYLYKSGELFGYYWDWEIVYGTEEIFECEFCGIPHAVNRIIARKPT